MSTTGIMAFRVRPPRGQLQLDSFEMMPTNDEPILRAVDHLASTVTYVCKAGMQPAEIRETLFTELAGITLPPLIGDWSLFAGA